MTMQSITKVIQKELKATLTKTIIGSLGGLIKTTKEINKNSKLNISSRRGAKNMIAILTKNLRQITIGIT